MRLKITSIMILLLALSYIPVSGSVFMSDQSNIVSSRDSLDDDLYIFGNYGEVYGIVEGDLTAFCYEHDAAGMILGNANIFAYDVRLGGEVAQTARLFGYTVQTDAAIGRNLLALGNEIKIDRDAIVNVDLNCSGNIVYVRGTVHGDAEVGGDIVYITGNIDGDVDITANEIYIDRPARIGGELTYTSKNKAEIDDDAIIEGGVNWKEPEEDIDSGDFSSFAAFARFLFFLMALVTGFGLIILLNRHTHEAADQINNRFWQTLAIGLLTFIICTGGAVVLCLFIVGIPLGLMLILLATVLFYIGKIYSSIAIGRLVFKFLRSGKKTALGWELMVGLIILTLLFRLPGLGWVVYILAFILGAGAAVTGYLSLCKKIATSKAAPDDTGTSVT